MLSRHYYEQTLMFFKTNSFLPQWVKKCDQEKNISHLLFKNFFLFLYQGLRLVTEGNEAVK